MIRPIKRWAFIAWRPLPQSPQERVISNRRKRLFDRAITAPAPLVIHIWSTLSIYSFHVHSAVGNLPPR